MRLDEERLEDAIVRLDLPLQLLVFLGAEARLALVRHQVVDVKLGPIRAQDRRAKAAFLQPDDLGAWRPWLGFGHDDLLACADDALEFFSKLSARALHKPDQLATLFPGF